MPTKITDKVRAALKRPPDFGWHGRAEMFDTWALGPMIETRDSTLLAQSNAAALVKHLETFPELAEDWETNECNHWLVGWVRYLSFRAVEDDRTTPTRMFDVMMEWYDSLSDYPVADESDYSEREYEATIANIQSAGRRFLKEGTPDDWPGRVFSWLWDNDQDAVENRDDRGGYPSDDSLKAALEALGYLADE